MLDDSEQNIRAFLTRGVLYAETGRYGYNDCGFFCTAETSANNSFKSGSYFQAALNSILLASLLSFDLLTTTLVNMAFDTFFTLVICRHEDAIPDFEMVVKLDTTMASAQVNLGLIYMLKMNNCSRYTCYCLLNFSVRSSSASCEFCSNKM